MIKELVVKNRSVRRYDNRVKIDGEFLRELVDIARACASAGNLQRIRYATVCTQEGVDAVRSTLSFAAYLKDWDGPAPNEDPTAYIVMLSESEDANVFVDAGIAASSMLLRAVECGYNGCIFRSINKEKLLGALGVEGLSVLLVISLGVASESVELADTVGADIKYYRENDVHIVPKRSLGKGVRVPDGVRVIGISRISEILPYLIEK